MKALIKQGRQLKVRMVPVPLPYPDEVRVRVRVAGLCRTDVQVARGLLPCKDPITLGHEFAGEIDALGADVSRLSRGDRVAVQPVLGCRTCPVCLEEDEINCPDRRMLGIDRDGAFAEFVVVPARLIYRLPASVSWQAAAYAEPVAAALALLGTGLAPGGRTLLFGRNRFSRLVEQLLRLHGYQDVTLCDPQQGDAEPPANAFDHVIETELHETTLARMVNAVRPRGLLVLKSRRPGKVSMEVLPLLSKQITLRAVNYGSFRKAVSLLVEGQLSLDELIGPVFALEEFNLAVGRDEQGEPAKLFFAPGSAHVRDRR